MSSVRTQLQEGLRGELYAVFGNRPRLIKAFENLLFDVSTTLPNNIAGNSDDTVDSGAQAQAATARAEGIAIEALALARAATEAPPQPATALPDIPDDVTALVMQLLARVSQLERDLANLREGPTP